MKDNKEMDDDSKLAFRFQMDVLLAEYDMVRSEVASYRQMQGNLDNIALVGLGLTIPLVLTILSENASSVGAVLLTPLLFFAIAYTQLRHERTIVVDSQYVHETIRPQAITLLDQLSVQGIRLFEFENFLSGMLEPKSILMQYAVTLTRAAISLGTGVGIILVVMYLQLFALDLDWQSYETVLLIINTIALVVVCIVGWLAASYDFQYRERSRTGWLAEGEG
jgi:hypothetical protein